jgi:lipopolysaccharide export system permease protein
MFILYRYLAKSIALPSLAVTAVALALFTTPRFISLLERAVENGVGSEVFTVLLLKMPTYLAEVLPLGFYLGVILGIGKLYSENEITAMISSGVPNHVLYIGVLVPAAVTTALLWAIMLWLAPFSSTKADELWRVLAAKTSFDLIQTGEFNSIDKDGKILYVENQSDQDGLTGLFYGDPARMQFIWSQSATLIQNQTDKARYFRLNEGVQFIGAPNSDSSNRSTFASQSMLISSPQPQGKPNKAHLLTNTELLAQGIRWNITEFLYRLLFPPIVLVLAILGLAFARTKPRQGRFTMVLPAVFTYSVYTIILSASIRPVYRSQAPYFTAMWWVHLLFLALAGLIICWPQLLTRLRRTS